MQKCCKCTFQGVGGHLGCNPKVISDLIQPQTNWFSFLLPILDLNIFIIVAAVPTGMQTCAKMLQRHLSGGGGTPWMQPKSNGKLKLASSQVVKFLAADFGFKYFHYSGHCAHRVANLCKSAANAHFRGWGDTLDATQK